MKIIFLRHAESEFNIIEEQDNLVSFPLIVVATERRAGSVGSSLRDCKLTPFGRLQASLLHGHYSLIICSPLIRSLQTLHCSQITYERLEINELVREYKEDICDFIEGEQMVLESAEDLIVRGDQLLDYLQLKKTELYPTILIISHCEFICSITGSSLENAQTTSIII